MVEGHVKRVKPDLRIDEHDRAAVGMTRVLGNALEDDLAPYFPVLVGDYTVGTVKMIVHLARIAYAEDVFPAEKSPVRLQCAARVAVKVVQCVVGAQQRVVLDLGRNASHAPERRDVSPGVVGAERIVVAIDDELSAANVERKIG